MNMPTPQQESFYRELAKRCDLTVLYEGEISNERRALGWDIVPEGYRHVTLGGRLCNIDIREAGEDFCLLSGLPGSIANILRIAQMPGDGINAIQSEMRSPDLQTLRRRFQTRLYSMLLRYKNVPIFGIGDSLRRYVENLGIDPKRVFPFAYFSPSSNGDSARWDGPVLYVGSLTNRKGVDILIRAFSKSKSACERGLVLVGDGSERGRLERLAKELGIDKLTKFVGSVSHDEVKSFMRQSSVLVLPSHFDGWGFVVNEALSVRVPCIVSDRCGVQEVIKAQGGGRIVAAGDVMEFSNALDNVLTKTEWDNISRQASVAHETLLASTGAEYFLGVIDHIRKGLSGPKPVVPWLTTNSASS